MGWSRSFEFQYAARLLRGETTTPRNTRDSSILKGLKACGTHTVVDPRAVVVHLKDAALAQAAVVCTVGLWQHALLAEAWLQRNWPQLYS